MDSKPGNPPPYPAGAPGAYPAPGAQPYPGQTQQPYPGQQQPYPAGGQPYPAGGQPYPAGGQPYPAAGQPYPAAGQAYPPQPGHPPQQGYPTSTTVVVGGGPVVGANYGPYPCRMSCPHCHADITTNVDYEIGALVWIVFGVLFGLGFLILITWFFCCVPCCITSLKDARHSCPNCHQHLGVYRRM